MPSDACPVAYFLGAFYDVEKRLRIARCTFHCPAVAFYGASVMDYRFIIKRPYVYFTYFNGRRDVFAAVDDDFNIRPDTKADDDNDADNFYRDVSWFSVGAGHILAYQQHNNRFGAVAYFQEN